MKGKFKITVREENGDIIETINDSMYGNETSQACSYGRYDEIPSDIRGAFPKYTRGKLKADISYRDIPFKELGHYDNEGVEIVLSKQAYDGIIEFNERFNEHNSEGQSFTCIQLMPEIPQLFIRQLDTHYSAQSIFAFVENTLCREIKYISSVEGLKEAHDLYKDLMAIKQATSIKTRGVGYYHGYHNDKFYNIEIYMPISEEYKSISSLSHTQVKAFKALLPKLKDVEAGETPKPERVISPTKIILTNSVAKQTELDNEKRKKVLGE